MRNLRSTPLLALLACVACAPSVHRYPLRAPVWIDDDLRPVDIPCRPNDDKPGTICAPEEYESIFGWDAADKSFFRPLTHFLSADVGGEAKNVNAFDEVPDSSWFTNRLGVRPMTVEEVIRGSCSGKVIADAPHEKGAWLIDAGKPNGANPGFRVKVEGVGKFLLKTDDPAEGEKATGATAIASRIYHAAGWWVACDTVVYLDPSWLKLKPGLTFAANNNETVQFDQARLDAILSTAQRRNGLVRMIASRWLPGKMLGPFRYEDTRIDDPNDIVPHEDRRDLRGARMIAAWLGHFDSREQNTMTSWDALDPDLPDSSPGRTIHWYIDLGDCFGSHWEWEMWNRRIGHSYYVDFPDIALDYISLGILRRPWDEPTPNKELPMFDYFRPTFEPEAWKGGYPNPAFSRMTERDGAWAARILSRFTDGDVEGAVSLGDYTDPRAPVFLRDALISRRDEILTRYFSRLSPLADPKVDGDDVCFTDLARAHGLFGGRYTYGATLHTGVDLRHDAALTPKVGSDGAVCFTLPRVTTDDALRGDDPRRYAVLDVTNGIAEGPVRAHFYDLGSKRGFALVAIERPKSASASL